VGVETSEPLADEGVEGVEEHAVMKNPMPIVAIISSRARYLDDVAYMQMTSRKWSHFDLASSA
jgi:hypothetical protein